MACRFVFQTASEKQAGHQRGQRLTNSSGLASRCFQGHMLGMAGMASIMPYASLRQTWHFHETGEPLIHVAHLLRRVPAAAEGAKRVRRQTVVM